MELDKLYKKAAFTNGHFFETPFIFSIYFLHLQAVWYGCTFSFFMQVTPTDPREKRQTIFRFNVIFDAKYNKLFPRHIKSIIVTNFGQLKFQSNNTM